MDKPLRFRMQFIVVLVLSIALSGCSSFGCCLNIPISEDQTVHYLVLGLGIVSVPKSGQKTAILATKVQALGVVVSDQPGAKLGIGYLSDSVVAIPDGAEDVRVEISQTPGGSLTVSAPSASLK